MAHVSYKDLISCDWTPVEKTFPCPPYTRPSAPSPDGTTGLKIVDDRKPKGLKSADLKPGQRFKLSNVGPVYVATSSGGFFADGFVDPSTGLAYNKTVFDSIDRWRDAHLVDDTGKAILAEPKLVRIDSLKRGQAFRTEYTKLVCVVTSASGNITMSAVCLETGDTASFNGHTMVEPISAELHIV